MAQRDLARRGRARTDWRTPTTERHRRYAKNMRSLPTEPERKLWSLVRDRRLIGYKFRRQVPIGNYIVDLVCPDHNLIVEVDGSQHAESTYDKARDGWLKAQGFRILRVWNNDVLARPTAVLDLICMNLQEHEP